MYCWQKSDTTVWQIQSRFVKCCNSNIFLCHMFSFPYSLMHHFLCNHVHSLLIGKTLEYGSLTAGLLLCVWFAVLYWVMIKTLMFSWHLLTSFTWSKDLLVLQTGNHVLSFKVLSFILEPPSKTKRVEGHRLTNTTTSSANTNDAIFRPLKWKPSFLHACALIKPWLECL